MQEEKKVRRGIQSFETAYRILAVLQRSQQALPLKEIASRASMTPSAVHNYLVSIVRTGLATPDSKPGYYRLGPSAVTLGMAAIEQIDDFELMRREVELLRDATHCSAAINGWTSDGPVSLFKQEGGPQGGFEIRTGLLSLTGSAAGRVYVATLELATTIELLTRELERYADQREPGNLRETYREELKKNGYVTLVRPERGRLTTIAAPIWNHDGAVKFVLSLSGSSMLQTTPSSAHVIALLEGCDRATRRLGGLPSLSFVDDMPLDKFT